MLDEIKRSQHENLYWESKRSRWRAFVRLGSEITNLGLYRTGEEAIAVREAYITLKKLTGVLRNVQN